MADGYKEEESDMEDVEETKNGYTFTCSIGSKKVEIPEQGLVAGLPSGLRPLVAPSSSSSSSSFTLRYRPACPMYQTADKGDFSKNSCQSGSRRNGKLYVLSKKSFRKIMKKF